jgi:hypothetical protein
MVLSPKNEWSRLAQALAIVQDFQDFPLIVDADQPDSYCADDRDPAGSSCRMKKSGRDHVNRKMGTDGAKSLILLDEVPIRAAKGGLVPNNEAVFQI